MAKWFQPAYIVGTDDCFIALRYIESIGFSTGSESETFDILNDDITLKIRTVSGREHIISLRQNIDVLSQTKMIIPDDIVSLRIAIYNKWQQIQEDR